MNNFLINHTVYCEYNRSIMNVLTTVNAYSNIFRTGRISRNTIRTRKSVNNKENIHAWIKEKLRTF